MTQLLNIFRNVKYLELKCKFEMQSGELVNKIYLPHLRKLTTFDEIDYDALISNSHYILDISFIENNETMIMNFITNKL